MAGGPFFWHLAAVSPSPPQREARSAASPASQTSPASPRSAGSEASPALGLARVLGPGVALLTFGVTLARANAGPQFRGDLASLRDLGLAGLGPGGQVSTLLTQGASLLPLGGRDFRASLVQAVGLALSAWLLFLLGAPALEAVFPSRRRAPFLAAVAATVVALAPTWQREGTVAGGALVAVALSLVTLLGARRWRDQPSASAARARALPWVGLSLGALFAESPSTALGLGLTLALTSTLPSLRRASTGPRVGLHGLSTAAGVAALTALTLAAPLALRALALRPWTDLVRGLAGSGSTLLQVLPPPALESAAPAYLHEIGLVALVAAGLGCAFALLRGRAGTTLLPLAALVLADLGSSSVSGLGPWFDGATLRCLALATLSLGTALGVHVACGWLRASQLPGARPAEALALAFHLTLAALASEEASFVADRGQQHATEEWTDLSLAGLSPGAALVVDAPDLALRFWSARLLRGERPDVLILPSSLLGEGELRRTIAATEPMAAGLLRDFALSGTASEFALSSLADERALYLEPKPPWSPNLLAHLAPESTWARFQSQPLGRSDRRSATPALVAGGKRVLEAARLAETDETADDRLIASVQASVRTMVQLGQAEEAQELVRSASALAPGDQRLSAEAFAPYLVPLPRSATPRFAATARSHRRR